MPPKRKILPKQIPPKLIELDYAGHLVKRIINPMRSAYAPLVKAVRDAHLEATKSAKTRTDYDPDEPRDERGRWGGGTSEAADAGRQPLVRNAPQGWNNETPLAYKAEEMAQKAALRAAYDPSKVYPKNWDTLDMISLPGHVYRGMGEAEYHETVGAGKGVISNNSMSVKAVEGTSFGYEAATANSYVNNGFTDPRKTGRPTYIVEVNPGDHITYNPVANYPQSKRNIAVPQETVTRVFQFDKSGEDDISFKQIPIPAARADADDEDFEDDEDAEDVEDISSKLRALLLDGRKKVEASLAQADIHALATKYGKTTSEFQKTQLNRQVKTAVGVDPTFKDPGLRARIGVFAKQNVTLVSRIPEKLHEDLANLIEEGALNGWLNEGLADKIADRFDISENHARLIARDQVGSLFADMNHDRQRSIGVTRFIWRCGNDERVRGNPDGLYPKADPSHWDLADQTYSYDDPPIDDTTGLPMLPGDPILCFPGSTVVSSDSKVHKLYRRFYRGEGTVLTTSEGRILTSTPNHPVLTRRGWVAAQNVQVGDDLIKAPHESIEVLSTVPNGKNRNPSFEEVFSAFGPLGCFQRGCGTDSFHGDSTLDEQVDIVNMDRSLSFELDPVFTEAFCQDLLCYADDSGLGPCGFDFVFDRVSGTGAGHVSRGGKLLAILLGGSRHALEHRLRTIEGLQTIAHELCPDVGTRNGEMFRHTFHTPPVGIELHHHLARVVYSITRRAIVDAPRLDTPSAQMLAEIISADNEGSSSLGESVRLHQFDRVVEKSSCELAVHVYNMETKASWYTAQGLVVHNCRCWSEPVLEDLLPDDDEDPEDTDPEEDRDPEDKDA